ncbi:MAG: AraC family transcriptional regulator [Verrucomicrobiaceae bacterium]|nr:AraC family transcriptional regulator [Verrucomicrobiaceae bacterium]
MQTLEQPQTSIASNNDIGPIAFTIEFQSLSQFNRSFSKIVGCSPTKFRESELTKAKLQA